MKFIFFVLIILFNACSLSPNQRKNTQPSWISGPYQGSTLLTYILPPTPEWANFSQGGECSLSGTSKKIDRSKFEGSFNYNYRQSTLLQLEFNRQVEEKKKELGLAFLAEDQEERILFLAKEKLESNHLHYPLGEQEVIHIYWVDPILKDQDKIKQFISTLEQKQAEGGLHFLASLCLNYSELNQWSKDNSANEFIIDYFSTDMVVIKEREGKIIGYEINFSLLFPKSTTINAYGFTKQMPSEMQGFKKYSKLSY